MVAKTSTFNRLRESPGIASTQQDVRAPQRSPQAMHHFVDAARTLQLPSCRSVRQSTGNQSCTLGLCHPPIGAISSCDSFGPHVPGSYS